MTDFTTTTNFSLKKPTVGQAVDTWGSYLNSNFDAIDQELQTLTVSITTPDLEDLGNVLADPPTANQYLQFNGENWTGVSVIIPTSVDDLTDVDISTTAPTANQVLTWNGSKFIPASPSDATIADASITTAKLDTGLQTQIGRILVTDDDDTPTNGQILQYNTTDSEWQYADLPGSTVVTLSDVNSGSLADNALLVYNSSAGEFQFESGATLRSTLGVDLAGTDNSTDITISSATSYNYITLSGQVLTLNQVDLQTDVANTLPVSSGGTGSTTASAARTALGLGTIATQDSDDVTITGGNISGIVDLAIADGGTGASSVSAARTNLGLGALATQDTITESQISDLQSYLTAEANDLSAAVTWANVPDVNITQSSVTQHQAALSITESQISDLQTYLTAETNDLGTAVTGTLGVANGGTGLTTIGTANQVLAVNAGATALEFQTLATGGTVTSVAVSGSDGIEVDSGSPITSSGTIALGINATSLSTHLGLGTAATTAATAYATSAQGATADTALQDIEHANSVTTAETISSGNHRFYVGPVSFSNTVTIAGKMLVFDGLYNQTSGTANITGTLHVRG